MEGKRNLVPRALFPGFGGGTPKPGKRRPGDEAGESRLSIGDGEQLCQDESKK